MKESNRVQTRSREDIIDNILEIATSPVKQTIIMYKANLSYAQLRYYLDLLQSKEMLRRQEDGLWLVMTRGREYLQVYADLQRIMDAEEPKKIPPFS